MMKKRTLTLMRIILLMTLLLILAGCQEQDAPPEELEAVVMEARVLEVTEDQLLLKPGF